MLLTTTFIIYICAIFSLYHNVLICKHQGIISWFLTILCSNEFNARQMEFSTFDSGWITFVSVMIVRLDQKTKHSKWEMYEFQTYALYEFIVIVLLFDGIRVYGFSPLLKTFVLHENPTKWSRLVAPILSSNLCGLKFHQLCVAVGIIWRWNKLHNMIILQDNTFQIIWVYIIEIFH